MKSILKIFVVLLLCLTLAACQEKNDPPEVSVPTSETTASVTPDAIPSELPSGEPMETPSAEPDEVKSEGLAEYQAALRQIISEHIYPDGTETGFDSSFGSMEDNQFALCDVTGDGVDELIVRFTTAPMAGNAETVYAFQQADGALKQILTASPNLTYYANGIIKEDWSHGSELAAEGYWPYTLYQYNAADGSFQELAQVNMWSKAVADVDFKGDPYPDEIDAEGAGTVFILGIADEVKTVSKSDYEKWLTDTMGDPAELDIPYQALSEENIEALN